MGRAVALACAWADGGVPPATIAQELADALASLDDAALAPDAPVLLARYRQQFTELEAAARAAFSTSPACAGSAFHSAAPDPLPFVLYRLPGILRAAGLYPPAELEALASTASPTWLARLALRHLAALALAAGAVADLHARRLPPAAFPAHVTDLVRSVTAIESAAPRPSSPEVNTP